MYPKIHSRLLFVICDRKYIELHRLYIEGCSDIALSDCWSESSNIAIFCQQKWSLQTKVSEMYPDSIFAYSVYFLPRKLQNFQAKHSEHNIFARPRWSVSKTQYIFLNYVNSRNAFLGLLVILEILVSAIANVIDSST